VPGKAGLNVSVIATEKSENRKLGSVSITMASIAGSCPRTCPLQNRGCYAQTSFVGMMVARMDRHVQDAGLDVEAIAQDEADAIDNLTGKRALRIHVAGDCTTDTAAQTVSSAAQRYSERHDQKVWGYTHAWRDVARDSWKDVSILASCETVQDVADARERGYAAAVVVDEFPGTKAWKQGDLTLIPCPEQAGTSPSCNDCRLCWNDTRLRERSMAIAFAVHGSGAEKAKTVALTVLA
jgi:hypothetical protein